MKIVRLNSLFLLIFFTLISIRANAVTHPIVRAHTKTTVIKNLANSEAANADYRQQVNQLIRDTNNTYTASLALLASSHLGDHALYATSLTTLLRSLHNLDDNPLPIGNDSNRWMENNSFKAWMWGRVLFAADNMNDLNHVQEARQKLAVYLNAPRTAEDKPAYFTWARAYLAVLNDKTYASEKRVMINESEALSKTYLSSQTHEDLSNALWAWVMDNQAAALHHDKITYERTLGEITKLTNEKTVVNALNKGLTRTASSNDYPAWAMAKLYLSAARMRDSALMATLLNPLTESISEAKISNQVAEWTLASLEFALAKRK